MRKTIKKTMKKMAAGFLAITLLPMGAIGNLKLQEDVKADTVGEHGALVSFEYIPADGYVELKKEMFTGYSYNELIGGDENGVYYRTIYELYGQRHGSDLKVCLFSQDDQIKFHFEDGAEFSFRCNIDNSSEPLGWYTILSNGEYADRFKFNQEIAGDDYSLVDFGSMNFYCAYKDCVVENGDVLHEKYENTGEIDLSVGDELKVVANYCNNNSYFETTIPARIVEDIESVEPEINGYQISSTAKGFRTVYSVGNAEDAQEIGMIYSIAGMATEDEMVVSSSNKNVYNYKATAAGEMPYCISDMENAKSYAMTMRFQGVSDAFYSANLLLRAYAKLEDGTYVYSDVKTVSVYDVADYLYQNRKMSNSAAHNYLYTDILSAVNKEYAQVDYDWSTDLVSQ